MTENGTITVFSDPSTRHSLDELRNPAVAKEFASYAELYVTQDAQRIICAGATQPGMDFSDAKKALANDPTITTDHFVRCPGPTQAFASAEAMRKLNSGNSGPTV